MTSLAAWRLESAGGIVSSDQSVTRVRALVRQAYGWVRGLKFLEVGKTRPTTCKIRQVESAVNYTNGRVGSAQDLQNWFHSFLATTLPSTSKPS